MIPYSSPGLSIIASNCTFNHYLSVFSLIDSTYRFIAEKEEISVKKQNILVKSFI